MTTSARGTQEVCVPYRASDFLLFLRRFHQVALHTAAELIGL